MGPAIPGDIPWSLVRLWAEDHDMTRSEFRLLDRVLQAMDRVYRDWWISRLPPPSTGGKKGGAAP